MLLLCNYYVTYRCNAYCSFCHFGKHNNYRETGDATVRDFEHNVNELAELGVKFIDLTGGEPLMHRDIHRLAGYAQQSGIQTSITTNTLLYPRFAEKLAGKINLLHFSLDSPDADEHNSIRGVNCFNSVVESIKIAKSLGEFPDILFTVTDKTYKKLPRMHELARKYDLVLLVNPVFSYFGNPSISTAALDFIEDYTNNKINVYLNKGFIKLRRDGGNRRDNPSCRAVSRSIVISPQNEIILPCYHFKNSTVIIDRPVREIMRLPEYVHSLQMEGRFDFCEGCTINCYFEPSFAFPLNLYSFISLSSKFKYGYNKLIKQKLKKVFQ